MNAAQHRYEVRWATFAQSVDKRAWRPCVWAKVTDETLIICNAMTVTDDGISDEDYTWVPLHTIRGEIQYRALRGQR